MKLEVLVEVVERHLSDFALVPQTDDGPEVFELKTLQPLNLVDLDQDPHGLVEGGAGLLAQPDHERFRLVGDGEGRHHRIPRVRARPAGG